MQRAPSTILIALLLLVTAPTSIRAAEEKTCTCAGVGCTCCVHFLDLGEGCVRMAYISPTDGLLVNVSYGASVVRSGIARGLHPAPTCLTLLGPLAAVCARFATLQPHGDGLHGCLQLEPQLLGAAQTHLDVGCFAMDAAGMRMLDHQEVVPQEALADDDDGSTTELDGDEILAVVNETAHKGLAFFQNWLGIDFVPAETEKDDEDNAVKDEIAMKADAQKANESASV